MRTLLALFLPILASAAIWPENAGAWKRASVQPATVNDRPLWNEYGFQEAETATFENGTDAVTVTAYRLLDSTGAMAAFEWQRPQGAKPSSAGPLSAQTAEGVWVAHGNYLVLVQGKNPGTETATAFVAALPRVEMAALPTLPAYLPAENLVPNSERYVTGPVGLEKFDPGIPPSVAAFHTGAEAQVASYRAAAGEIKLAIFNYPTPQLAMQQAESFQKVSGAMVKRTGPLVAVILSASSADAAEHVLSMVRYQGAVTLNERTPTRKDNVGNMMIAIFELAGILLLFALVSGLAFGGLRVLLRRGHNGQESDAMIVLHLRDPR